MEIACHGGACVCVRGHRSEKAWEHAQALAQACAQAKGASGPGGMHSGHKCMGRAVM